MMFIAMLFVIIAIFLLVVGIVSFIVNIILTFVFAKYGKKNKICRVLKFICPFLSIGSLVLMIPFGLLAGWFVYKDSRIPEEYVECETKVIFTNEGFETTSGEKYVNMFYNLGPKIEDYKKELVPVFSYKPKGYMSRHRWRNVYLVETGADFPLYFSHDEYGWYSTIYAKKEDVSQVEAFYEENHYWKSNCKLDPLSDELSIVIEKYRSMDSLSATEIQLGDYTYYSIDAYSLDNLLIIESYRIYFSQERVFLSTYTNFNKYYQYFGYELLGEEKELVEKEIHSPTLPMPEL